MGLPTLGFLELSFGFSQAWRGWWWCDLCLGVSKPSASVGCDLGYAKNVILWKIWTSCSFLFFFCAGDRASGLLQRLTPTSACSLIVQMFHLILINSFVFKIMAHFTSPLFTLYFPHLLWNFLNYFVIPSINQNTHYIRSLFVQILGALRFPITLHSTFIELATIR